MHVGHDLEANSTRTKRFDEASMMFLVAPPTFPTGKRVCTGGSMCLGLAASGLPTLTPKKMGALFLIATPDVAERSSRIDPGSCAGTSLDRRVRSSAEDSMGPMQIDVPLIV